MVDNIISAQEAKDKIDMLNGLDSTNISEFNSKLKDIEQQLGVSIADDESDTTMTKDPMRETKNTFLSRREQAEEFVKNIHEK